jgi:hypothetical protein
VLPNKWVKEIISKIVLEYFKLHDRNPTYQNLRDVEKVVLGKFIA